MTEPRCIGCGCGEHNACAGGCFWVLPEAICSRCAMIFVLLQAVQLPEGEEHVELLGLLEYLHGLNRDMRDMRVHARKRPTQHRPRETRRRR